MVSELRKALVTCSARVIDLFKEWDTSGDGLLQKKEFRDGLTAFGLTADRAVVDALFGEWDADGSGAPHAARSQPQATPHHWGATAHGRRRRSSREGRHCTVEGRCGVLWRCPR